MKISELRNAPQWLLEASTENADVDLVSGFVIWNGGVFSGGVFSRGLFSNGEFRGGVFRGVEFRDGVFSGGVFSDGVFSNGEFLDGKFIGGKFIGGRFRGFSGKLIRMANIDGSLREIILIRHKNGVQIEAGLFFGDSSEFLKRAKSEKKMTYVSIVGAVVEQLLKIDCA